MPAPDCDSPRIRPIALGRHDLVRALVLDHAVLMDAGLVLEGVGTDDRLVGLALHPRVLGHHLGRRRDVDGVDARVQSAAVELLPSLEGEGHDDLLEGGVAGPLPDAVDGALQLPGAVESARQGVGGGQTQIVVTVRAKDDVVGTRDVIPKLLDDIAKFPRHVPSRRIGNVERRGARLDGGTEDAVQKVRIGPSGIFRAEFDIVAAQALGEFDGVDGNVHHLVGRLLELVVHVNLGRGDEGVDARPDGILDGIPRHGYVPLVGAGQAADYGHVPIVVHLVADRVGNLPDGVEVVGTGDGEAGLDDVDAQLGEVAGDLELLGRGQGGAGGLLAVAEGRVEDADVVGVGDAAGDVFRTRTALQVGIVAPLGAFTFATGRFSVGDRFSVGGTTRATSSSWCLGRAHVHWTTSSDSTARLITAGGNTSSRNHIIMTPRRRCHRRSECLRHPRRRAVEAANRAATAMVSFMAALR